MRAPESGCRPPLTRQGRRRRPNAALDVAGVRRHWDLGEWRSWKRTPRGSSNVSSFVETDRGRYVVRVSNARKTDEGADWEVSLLARLRERGLPVPAVVPTRDGRPWTRVGGFVCLVTERIPGGFPDPSDPAHLDGVARALARFHHAARDLPEEARPAAGSELPGLSRGAEALAAAREVAVPLLEPAAGDRFRRAEAAVAEQFATVHGRLEGNGDRLPELVTHGSLGFSAVLFDGPRLTAILDFERAAREARALDLAYTLRALARSPADEGAFDAERLGRLMRSYRAVEAVPEADLLPLAMRAQRLVKVRRKALNLVAQSGITAQREKDALKLLGILETEVVRLRWLECHEDELLGVLAGDGGAGR